MDIDECQLICSLLNQFLKYTIGVKPLSFLYWPSILLNYNYIFTCYKCVPLILRRDLPPLTPALHRKLLEVGF